MQRLPMLTCSHANARAHDRDSTRLGSASLPNVNILMSVVDINTSSCRGHGAGGWESFFFTISLSWGRTTPDVLLIEGRDLGGITYSQIH